MFLFFSFLFAVSGSDAQSTDKGDTVSFCFLKFKIPGGCKLTSENQLSCDNYSMSWTYLTPQTVHTIPEQMINQLAAQTKKFRKEPVPVYLLGNPAKGYKISFKTDQGSSHQLIAYGFANEQLVLVQLTLDKEPGTDEDIPSFPKQIISFSK